MFKQKRPSNPLNFIRPELVKEYFQEKKRKERIILFFSLSCVFVLFLVLVNMGVFFVKQVPEEQIIKEEKIITQLVTQEQKIIAGRTTKWVKLVPIREITEDKTLVKLPKSATNITIKAVTAKPTIQQTQLTSQDRQTLLTLVKPAQPSEPTNFLASLLTSIWRFFFAGLEETKETIKETIEEIISPPAQEPTEIIETGEAIVVDVSSILEEVEKEAKEEKKAEKEGLKEEKKEEKEELKEEKKEETQPTLEVPPVEVPPVETPPVETPPSPEPETTPEAPPVEAPLTPEPETTPEEQPLPAEQPPEQPIPTEEQPVPAEGQPTPSEQPQYVQVEYETPAPEITEQDTSTGKLITVSAPDELEYKDVLAFSAIPEIFKVGDESKIKIKWQNNNNQDVQFNSLDLNGNGKLDYVEWTVPYLSDQIFEIIFISKAFKLNENREIIEDIYDQVRYKDNNWSTIENNQYVRVTFQQILTNQNDITLYAKPTNPGESTRIEVYTENSDQLITTFENIDQEGTYKVLLTNLPQPTDVFDLKVLGAIEIDYIVDPETSVDYQTPPTPEDGSFTNSDYMEFEVSGYCDETGTCQCELYYCEGENLGYGCPPTPFASVTVGEEFVNQGGSDTLDVGINYFYITALTFLSAECPAGDTYTRFTTVRDVTYDNTPPTTDENLNGYTSDTWAKVNVNIDLTCNDDNVCSGGTAGVYYCEEEFCDPSPSGTLYTSQLQYTSETTGTYLRYQSKDLAGNWQIDTEEIIIKIDNTAPTTSDDYAYNNVWVTSNQTITLTPNCDISGCEWTRYCTDTNNTCDPSTGTSYTVPVTISTEGTTYFRYASKDNAQNTQTTVSTTVKIDKTPPTVTNVTSDTTNGTYGTDDVIDVDVVFSEAVTVTGTPQITLSTGTPATTAVNYSSGSGTTTLTFNYTVVAGNSSSDLDYSATSSLALNSGTIKDAAGNDATLTLASPGASGSLGANKDIVIVTDSTAPTVSFSATADSTSQITWTASATDSGVGLHTTAPYQFRVYGSTASDWQLSGTLISTGLSINTAYTYQVRARDAASNASEYTSLTKYTLANTPGTPTLAVDSASQIIATWSANSNPSGTEYYVVNETNNNATSDWTTNTSWASSGLTCNTSYTFKVKARNGDTTETDYSTTASATTSACPSAGGGGLPAEAFMPPTPPLNGFQVLINGGSATTDIQDVVLSLRSGNNTVRMSISNDPNFINAVQEEYQITKQWRLSDAEGQKTVYVKFFTSWGVSSETITASIIYRIPTPITPLIEIIIPPAPPIIGPPPIEPIPPQPPVEEVVPEKAPTSMQGTWDILPTQPIKRFALSPLPQELRALAQKFPQFSKTLEEIGVSKITDINKLVGATFTLPTLSQATGLAPISPEPGQIVIPTGIPLENLTDIAKEKIPTEIFFVKTGGGLVDYNATLSLNEQGRPQQQINILVSQPLQLIVKPDKPAKAIKGYLIFEQKRARPSSRIKSSSNLTASLLQEEIDISQTQKPTELKQALVLLEFDFSDPDNDGIWTAEINSPVVDGEYKIITVIDYQDQRIQPKELSLITVVDPEGYVFTTTQRGEVRIKDAKISLYWLDPETKSYQLWPAKDYQQVNPQITDSTGRYSFLVPEGTYYLEVEARGYSKYQSDNLEVKIERGIHINIELKPKIWWLQIIDWKTVIVIVLMLCLAYNFYKDRKTKMEFGELKTKK